MIFNMKSKLPALILIFCLFSCHEKTARDTVALQDSTPPIDKSLAVKPPMGWNSWDCLGWGATETEVRAAADYMAKNLKHLGYEYVVIDMLWYGDAEASDFEAFVHETIPLNFPHQQEEKALNRLQTIYTALD
jgi:hypothetical protein